MKTRVIALAVLSLSQASLAQVAQPPVVGPPGNASATMSASPAPAKTILVPSGTRVLLGLKAPVDTKTAKPGDLVYLTSTFPTIVESRVVIPAGMDVQGVIDSVERPGRVKGRAQVTMHFTTLILPNGSVITIPGSVDSVPGADGPAVKGKENTIEQSGSVGQDARNIATTTSAGIGVGGLATMGNGNPGVGIGYGALAGSVAGVVYTLSTRGKDIVLETGQPLEMTLQRPLILNEKDAYVPPQTQGTQFVPAPNQPRPLPKPQPQN